MKKIFVLIFIISLSLLWSCSQTINKPIKIKYNTITVWTWTITQTQSYIWYIKWNIQTMLATKAPWRITYLAKKVWDKIYKWELIAKLDWAEAISWYNTANSIVSSLYGLKNATKQSFDEQIKAMQAKIAQAKAWLTWITTWLQDTKNITQAQIQTTELWLKTAQTNLEQTKQTLIAQKQNILAWAKSAITQNIILNDNIIDFTDKLLWVTDKNKYFNDQFENYLWVKDQKHFKENKDIFRKAKKLYDDYKNYYDNYIENKNPTEQQLIIALNKAKITSDQTKKLLDSTYTTLDNSIANVSFPLTMINQYKNQVSTLGSNLEKSLMSMSWDTMIWIDWSLENLKSFDANKKKAIALLTKKIEIAKQQLVQYKSMANWQVNNIFTKKQIAQKQLEQAQAWLQALIAWKNAKLKELDSKIAEALWHKNLSEVYINNGKVYSPINWVIVSKNANIDQVIWAWMPIYTVATTNKLKVDISVPSFISKSLSLYQNIPVKIESTNKTYTWTIIQLPNIKNQITKKTDLEILLNNDKNISIWSTAKVFFKIKNNINSKDNAILIPNNAIIEKYMIPWVYIIKNKKAVFTKIKILSFDEKYSQVKWIPNNTTIITDWKENIYDWENLN